VPKETRAQFCARLIRIRGFQCQAQEYRPHVCRMGLSVNEMLINKRKVPKEKQDYINCDLNCGVMCLWSHSMFGETKEFRKWWRGKMEAEVGREAVAEYLRKCPTKVKWQNHDG
jgi:hypothetical protein